MERHRAAAAIAAAALLLGLAGDVLIRYIPWGINAALWTLLLIGAAFFARSRASSAPVHLGAAAACVLLGAGIAWRDSPVLLGADVVLLLLFLPMLALHARGVRVAAAGLGDLVIALFTTGFQSIAGFPQLLIQDVSWSAVPRGGFRTAKIATRGSFMAAPALLIFGSLLWHADPAFARVLRDLIGFDLRETLLHLVVIGFFFATTAGFLRSLAFSGPIPLFTRGLSALPAAETNFALLLINILFAAFVGVQFRYFFGANLDATASAYARRGFFELVWVVALVLPMLLVLDFLVKREQLRLFRTLAAVQIALVFVIAVSAYRRMQLYRDEYGLTQLRLYTTAFMIWIAVLLLWFALTVLTGHRERFAVGVLTAGIAMLAALHAINPDALIVETNLARAREGRRALDADYATSLSDDATPVILANARYFPKDTIDNVLTRSRPMGWRTWNASRARAIEAVRDYESKATPPIGRP
jgi:hypothetical protein